MVFLCPVIAKTQIPLGNEFQVNTYTTDIQERPRIAFVNTSAPGAQEVSSGFVVVWHSIGSSGTDDSLHSVQGQRFLTNFIFSGDFDTGDTSGWIVFP